MDGKNFFAADVMRSAFQSNINNSGGGAADPDSSEGSDQASPVATAAAQRKPNKRP
jgi:hypothetical protein